MSTQQLQTAPPAAGQSQLMHMIKDNSVKPAQLIKSEQVKNQFIKTYAKINGIANQSVAQAFYEAEQFHFLKLINDAPDTIGKCTKLSLYGIFMDVAVSGLSFDPTMKHVYVVPFNINVGTKAQPVWEKRASLMIAGAGELVLRQRQGQIKYADNPVLVFDGDHFVYGTKNGGILLEHTAAIPRKSDKIIACYLKITRADNTTDYKVMSMEDIIQLRKFSKDENSLAWTKGIAGMVQAKTIKHAFRAYPKVRVGNFSQTESDYVEQKEQEIDYGIEIEETATPAEETFADTPPVQVVTETIVTEDETF